MIGSALAQAVKTVESVERATPKLKALKKACDGMESNFLRQMLSAMHKTVQETDLGGDHTGMDEYKSMFDGSIADRLAERGTLGISKMTFDATAGRAMNDAFKDRK